MNEIEQLPFGGEIVVKKPLNLPLTTQKKYLEDKGFPYELYGVATLLSHKNPEEEHRYFYHDELRRLLVGKGVMTARTFNRQMKILRASNDLVEMVVNPDKTISYRIFYEKDKMWYTTIDSRVLEMLVLSTKETVLKAYINLLIYCNYDDFRQVTDAFLLERVGLSPESNKIIRSHVNCLERMGLIETRLEQISTEDANGNVIVTRRKYYKLKKPTF